MVDFLNNFSNSCSHRLFMFDRKISKIEAELRLLEIKLNSLPGFEDERSTDIAIASHDSLQQPESSALAPMEPPILEAAVDQKAPEEPVVEEIDPAVKKYVKMVQVGVPVEAVKQKMLAEGVDPNLLKM